MKMIKLKKERKQMVVVRWDEILTGLVQLQNQQLAKKKNKRKKSPKKHHSTHHGRLQLICTINAKPFWQYLQCELKEIQMDSINCNENHDPHQGNRDSLFYLNY